MKVFTKYMEERFIGKKVRGKENIRTVPLFPINIWNCYNRVLAGEARTNNGIEEKIQNQSSSTVTKTSTK